jgi:hypothetical protein
MLGLLPARLRQLRVVVDDVEPFQLPILVGVDELVREVLLGGVFAHLDAGSSQDLFFPASVFMLFDGEDFILQVQRVFTRIRSGAS